MKISDKEIYKRFPDKLFLSVIILFTAFNFFYFSTSDFSNRITYSVLPTERLNKLYCPGANCLYITDNNQIKYHDVTTENNSIKNIEENLKNEEYNISFDEVSGTIQSPNRANNLRFIYHKDGFTAKLRSNKIPLFDISDKTIREKDKKYKMIDERNVKFRIMNNEFKLIDKEIETDANKAWIEDDKIRINYSNTAEGMRQDFIVKQKLSEKNNLKLNFTVDTKLKLITGPDALIFKDNNGEEKMKYSDLKAWDACGKILHVYFLKNESVSGFKKSFSIVVNDENAVYPITIDPLSTSPNWTAEGNQMNAYFGTSVATAGDVNGDGYSDVIVGAANYDNGEADEGMVFVYHGSATGLSASSNWTSEGNQTMAYFGWSVSTAGDVNNDGYSDIIIGANQYDNDQTNEGKVFVYHGSSSGLLLTPDWTSEGNLDGCSYGWRSGINLTSQDADRCGQFTRRP